MNRKMIIIDVDWSPKVNILTIGCQCGNMFKHPANRKVIKCPKCGATEDCIKLKGMIP